MYKINHGVHRGKEVYYENILQQLHTRNGG